MSVREQAPDSDVIQSIVDSSEPDRLLGALLGMAVGDALGTTLEFRELDAPGFPRLAQGPHRQMVGGGPFHVAPGQVTDDTQLAVCLAQSVVDKRALDPEDLGRRYVAWKRVCFDIGAQTSTSIERIERGEPARDAGRHYWESRGRQPAGNGSLMRTTPIGVLFAADDNARRDASLTDSAITHFDPRCQLACAAFNSAIAHAVQHVASSARAMWRAARDEFAAGSPRAMWQVARDELDSSARLATTRYPDLSQVVDQARADLVRDLEAALDDDPCLYGPEIHLQEHQGFVRVAFRLAFWQLMHAPSYEAALVDVVNRGGDADTNGAITGALLGACHGLGAIPRPWLDPVLEVFQDQTDNPWWSTYHPILMVRALEHVYQRPLMP